MVSSTAWFITHIALRCAGTPCGRTAADQGATPRFETFHIRPEPGCTGAKLLKQAKMSSVNRYVRSANHVTIGLALLSLMMAGCSRNTPSLEPTSISTNKVPGLIRSLPAYAHLSLSGVAF